MTHYAVRIYFWVPELRPIEIHKVFERELLNAQVHFAVLVLMRLHHRMLLSRSYADCDTSTNWLSTQRASFCCQTEKKRAPQVSAFRFLTPSKEMQNTGTALCSLFDWDFASIRYRAVCLCLSATVELELYFVIWCICSLGRLGGFLCLSLTLSTNVLLAAAYQTGSTWCSLTAHTHVQHKNDLSWIYTFIAQLNLDLITF